MGVEVETGLDTRKYLGVETRQGDRCKVEGAESPFSALNKGRHWEEFGTASSSPPTRGEERLREMGSVKVAVC